MNVDKNKNREFKQLSIEGLELSRFNTRKERSKEKVEQLTERIKRNGFEMTRALWVYPENNHYEVFAGGTRLEAAKLAELEEIPCLVHTDYSIEEISRLADEDNENDEYHEPVGVVDVWAEYYRLSEEEGWAQKKIAEVKGTKQSTVSRRVRFSQLPEKIKDFIRQDVLTEAHLDEIAFISVDGYFSPWLTSERATLELAEKIKHDTGKNGAKTVKATREDAKKWKEFIAYAEQVYEGLPEGTQLFVGADNGNAQFESFNAKDTFLQHLVEKKARSLPAVKECEHKVRNTISNAEKAHKDFLEGKAESDAEAEAKRQREAEIIAKYLQGDCCEVIEKAIEGGELKEGSVKLLITDPPFGKDYQSSRRWQTNAPEKITADKDQNVAYEVLSNVLDVCSPLMAEDAHLLVKSDWSCIRWMMGLLELKGWQLKRPVVWVKEEHSAGDLNSSFGPSHEVIIHAVKGKPLIRPRIRDVVEVSRSNDTSHPMETPVALWEKLIESTTNEGDLVLDPFAGTGSVPVAATNLSRDFFAVELSVDFRDEGLGRLLW